ncbi:hypothetical protein, partial [Escherichia coli]|uniref:hypothetical protein n=8 Tax=Escherichia coli TaxID=562 RepID=UPI000DFBED77
FIKSPVLCCGENITFHQVAKFSVPLQLAGYLQVVAMASDIRCRITKRSVKAILLRDRLSGCTGVMSLGRVPECQSGAVCWQYHVDYSIK